MQHVTSSIILNCDAQVIMHLLANGLVLQLHDRLVQGLQRNIECRDTQKAQRDATILRCELDRV